MKQNIELILPRQMQLLCKLLDTTPTQLLQGFINAVNKSPHHPEIDYHQRAAADFYLLHSFTHPSTLGQTTMEIMLEELEIIRKLTESTDKLKHGDNSTYEIKQWYERWDKIKETINERNKK